jgi:DNA gyrase subunit B
VTAALREVPPSASAADGYTARHLTVLEGLEAVRKRPGMYIGSTDERGLLHCLWEIFDNAVDEALHASCTAIEVILHADGSAEVRDDGRGIPVDIEPKTGLAGVELVILHGFRRPARCRRLGGERAVGSAGRADRPGRP